MVFVMFRVVRIGVQLLGFKRPYCNFTAEFMNDDGILELLGDDKSQLNKTLTTLQDCGYDLKEVKNCRSVLKIPHNDIREYTHALKELGVKQVKPIYLAKFKHIQRKSLKRLITVGIIPADANPLSTLLSHLDMPEDCNDELIKRLRIHVDTQSIQILKGKILVYYLPWKLGLPPETPLHRITYLNCKSFTTLQQNINLYVTGLGVDPKQLKNRLHLLRADPVQLSANVEENPIFAGISYKELAQKLPCILYKPMSLLREIADTLEEHEIPAYSVRRAPQVFKCDVNHVKQRLSILQTYPQFEILKHHPLCLKLVSNRQAANPLELILKHNIKSFSINVCLSASKFNDALQQKHYNSNAMEPIMYYISNVLSLPTEEVLASLEHNRYWKRVPLMRPVEALQLLRQEGITELQIKNCVLILVYSVTAINCALNKARHQDDWKFWENHPRLLHLLLYYIEREFEYTGDGVFKNDNNSEKHFGLN